MLRRSKGRAKLYSRTKPPAREQRPQDIIHKEGVYTHGVPPHVLHPHQVSPGYTYPTAYPVPPYSPHLYHSHPPNNPLLGSFRNYPQSESSGANTKKSHPLHDHPKPPHGHHHHPPPPPGRMWSLWKYLKDSFLKRPIFFLLAFSGVAFYTHRIAFPDSHHENMRLVLSELQRRVGTLDDAERQDSLKVTRLQDSLQKYSSSFVKASSGSTMASAFDKMQSASALKHMKGLESSLTEQNKQDILSLTNNFHAESRRIDSALGATANQLRHSQLMGILVSDEADETSSKQYIQSIQDRFNKLMNEKFSLETRYIQQLSELLNSTQKEKLCRELLGNNSPAVSHLLKEPVLYPEISGLSSCRRAVFVLQFDGDMTASGVSRLRHEITAVIENADKHRGDRVVLVLRSGGGTVGGYGLGASQLERIKAAGLHLTVCVDEVAASGGYLMACVADNIVSAPFATLGSIGVFAMMPNVYERLKREGIEVETLRAGKYKQILHPAMKTTPEKLKKAQEELDSCHRVFKSHIRKHRPEIDVETVATGESWLATEAIKLGLCDSICTSDDYILQQSKHLGTEVYKVNYRGASRKALIQHLLQPTDDEDAAIAESRAAKFLSNVIAMSFDSLSHSHDTTQRWITERRDF